MARILVTGATGFIGAEVVRRLLARGDEVVALARASSDRRELGAAEVVLGALEDAESLRAAVRGVDAVVHLASVLKVPWQRAFFDVNVDGTRALAVACAEEPSPPVLVVVSSLAAGGPSAAGEARIETDGAHPVSRYGRMKLACEDAAREQATRIPLTIVRPPMVIGGGDRWALALFRSAQRGMHVVPTWGDARLSFLHVTDLADAIAAAIDRGERVTSAETGVYYTAGTERPTYAELGRWIGEAVGAPRVRVIRVPSPVVGAIAGIGELVARLRGRPTILNLDKWRESRAGDWVCDAAKARRDLGLTCGDGKQRLKETADTYRRVGWL